MRDNGVWPPPPDLPPSSGPYDDLLTSILEAELKPEHPATRIFLVRALRERTGIGLKEAKDVVDDYYTRYGIRPSRTGLLGCMVINGVLALLCAAIVFLAYSYQTALDRGASLAERHSILRVEVIVASSAVCFTVLVAVALVVRNRRR